MSTLTVLDFAFAKQVAEALNRHGLRASARVRKGGDLVANISFLCTNHDDHNPSAFLSVHKHYEKVQS